MRRRIIQVSIVAAYLETLNDAQREAVVNFRSPSLIIAGAGSGKTRVLTCRIAYMLEQGVDPGSIIALTFTNKAAREMRERIGQLLSPQATRRIWMGTFHSLFSRILRTEAELLGYPSSYSIYDASDAKNLVKAVIKELKLSDETYKPGDIAARISLAKNNLITPAAYEANASLIAEDRERRRPQFVDIYKLYAQKCKQNGAMDFDDLLLNTNILFRDHPDVLVRYRERFRYILVDEYQDTNVAQYVIIRNLAAGNPGICVVGDDAQSIYSFRGAKIENILRFRNDFPSAQTFKLEQNYRSTQTIVNAANSIIEKNKKRLQKQAFSKGDVGEKIGVVKAYTDKEEAMLIASDIVDTIRDQRIGYDQIAILYRTNAQSRALEEALRGRNVPYKIFGGVSFYQRKEIKDLLAYIRLVINPRDDEAFLRIINTPSRGIGDVTVSRIADAAARKRLSLWEAVSELTPEEMELKGAASKRLTDFVAVINDLASMRAVSQAHELALEIASRSGIIGMYKIQQTPEAVSALENIEELINSVRAFSEERAQTEMEEEGAASGTTLEEWLQNVALMTDMDNEKPEDRNRVTLMTVHGAKGLEFDCVYVAGLEENLFPSLMSMGNQDGLEEERRLFYVALTRARRKAVLSFAESRFKWGEMTFCRPSRFLGEIDPRYLDIRFDPDELTTVGKPDSFEKPQNTFQRGAYGYAQNRGAAKPDSRPVYEPSHSSRPNYNTPKVGLGTQFRSVGRRPVTDTGSNPDTATNRTTTNYATPPSGQQNNQGEIVVGMTVHHDRFGTGRVIGVEEMSGDTKITVDFNGVGRKTLLKRFARLTIV